MPLTTAIDLQYVLKMNNCSENHSESISTQNCNSYGDEIASTVVPILILAITILTMLLGSEIIYSVHHNKTLRDPVSALIVSVTASLMVLSIIYSLYC